MIKTNYRAVEREMEELDAERGKIRKIEND